MESQQGGVIELGEQQMLVRALEFSDRFVREAMIPRTDIVAVEKDSTLGELLRIFSQVTPLSLPRVRRRPGPHRRRPDHEGGAVGRDRRPISASNRPLAELDVIQPALVVPESRGSATCSTRCAATASTWRS